MTHAIGYVRVSTEEQADSGLGLEAQRRRIISYCSMKNLELAEMFCDDGVSGSKPLKKRPQGVKLLSSLRKAKPVVVIAKLDRIFRSVLDCTSTIEHFDKMGVGLISLAENFDTSQSNPFARAMLQMVSIFAELERSLIRQRTWEAMNVKRLRGERISHNPRYGYEFTPDYLVVECKHEQEVVKQIREMRGDGMSLQKIADCLNAKQIPSKCGVRWCHPAVRSVLSQEPS